MLLSRADLIHAGYTRRSIQAAVRTGILLHVRRDCYLPGGTDDAIVRAVRVGGRLTCLSLLAAMGVFVLENRRLHVHVHPNSARLRDASDRRKPRDRTSGSDTVLHWLPLCEGVGASSVVSLVDAAVHAVRCQPPRAAVATLDSLLNKRLLTPGQVREVFAALPARYAPLEPLVDACAESGTETLVRLMARSLGCEVRIQVVFEGIGRVDLLLDGWLVVECDSREFHSDWQQQVRDRERDLALAARGYCTLRITAAMILYQPDAVLAALRALLSSRPRG